MCEYSSHNWATHHFNQTDPNPSTPKPRTAAAAAAATATAPPASEPPAASPSPKKRAAASISHPHLTPTRRAALPTAAALALFLLGLLLAFCPLASAAAQQPRQTQTQAPPPPDPVAAMEGVEEEVALPVPPKGKTNLTSHMTADAALFPRAALKRFDADIKALAGNGTINGARVLGAQDGKIILDYTAGYDAAKAAGGEPWFRLFSMTKPVTAALALILAEEGVLSLDDEFARYVPELGNLTVYEGLAEFVLQEEEEEDGKKKGKQAGFLSRPAHRNATVRELLTHTAGFAYGDNMNHPVDEAYDRAMLQNFYQHTTESFLRVCLTVCVCGCVFGWLGRGGRPTTAPAYHFITPTHHNHNNNHHHTHTKKQELRNIPLLTEPGSEFHYSLGFDVLGVVLARAAGKSLQQLMREKIFLPLGMKRTGFHLPAHKPGLLAPMAEEEDFGTGLFNDIADAESDKVC